MNMIHITSLAVAFSALIYVCSAFNLKQHQQHPHLRLPSTFTRPHRTNFQIPVPISNHKWAPLSATESPNVDSDDAMTTATLDNNVQQQQQLESSEFLRATQSEAQDALNSVGWSIPAEGDLTSDDPFVQMIDRSIQKDIGVPLDELLNPAKVVNLERDLYMYRTQLAKLTGATIANEPSSAPASSSQQLSFLITENCDNGGGGIEADELRNIIKKKEADLLIERRSVFRNWLKNVFLIQAVLSFGLSYVMASNSALLFGQFDWYMNPKYNMDISISVLGYWWWWLFVIPSLRSRRPKGFEKQALDIAFLASPIISLIAPIATKNTELIWYANFLVVAGAYGFAYVQQQNSNDDDTNHDDDATKQPEWLKFVYKSLDFGTGRERGARN
jgi:hypothetical protein